MRRGRWHARSQDAIESAPAANQSSRDHRMPSIDALKSAVPLDPRERKLLRSRSLILPVMLAIDIIVIAIVIVAPDWYVPLPIAALLFGPPTVYAAITRSRLFNDLLRGIKLVGNGVVVGKDRRQSEDQTTYRVRIRIGRTSKPLSFRISEPLYDALYENQNVRIAYAPLSRTLLELEGGNCDYVAVDDERIRDDS
ncbi:hypothetical protein [Pseudomonas sp. CGJS7]|uniref:hypothetical protein n=1 Tax=Pseudomonas sp. CGJS7 TaxID=3109348 RepID=UPI003009DC25